MEFSDQQRLFLATICTHFHTHAKWPTYGFLDHELMDHEDLDVEDVGKELEPFMFDSPYAPMAGWDPDREAFLGLSALHRCLADDIYPALTEDLNAFMQAVRLCVEKYVAGDANPQITEAEMRERFGMSDLMLRKVFQLMQRSDLSGGSSSNSDETGEPIDWTFRASPNIRRYRRVATVEDYLAARQKLLAPRPPAPFNPAARLPYITSPVPASIYATSGGETLSDTQAPPAASPLNAQADVSGASADTPEDSGTEDLDSPYAYLWDGDWLTHHHRITMGDEMAVHPVESEGNAVTKLIHQFVSALAAESERRGKRLEEIAPFGSFSYVAVVTPSLVEVVFGRSVHGRYAIHRDMRQRNAEAPIAELEETARRRLGWTTTVYLLLPSNLLAQAADDRQAIIDARAGEVAEKLMPNQSTETPANAVTLRPISLFPHGPFTRNERLCFVLMPFAEEMQSVYDDGIFPAATHLKLECRRADEIIRPGGIMAQVWQSLMEARIVIADLTNMNPNVFYELGLAHVIGHDVILLTQDMKFAPFDLRHMRCFTYVPDQPGLRQLEQNLRRVIREVLAAPQGTA